MYILKDNIDWRLINIIIHYSSSKFYSLLRSTKVKDCFLDINLNIRRVCIWQFNFSLKEKMRRKMLLSWRTINFKNIRIYGEKRLIFTVNYVPGYALSLCQSWAAEIIISILQMEKLQQRNLVSGPRATSRNLTKVFGSKAIQKHFGYLSITLKVHSSTPVRVGDLQLPLYQLAICIKKCLVLMLGMSWWCRLIVFCYKFPYHIF